MFTSMECMIPVTIHSTILLLTITRSIEYKRVFLLQIFVKSVEIRKYNNQTFFTEKNFDNHFSSKKYDFHRDIYQKI